MRKLFLTLISFAVAASAMAQVSYMQMVEERSQNARYIQPATLTPVANSHQYMELDGKQVVLYDYNRPSDEQKS